MQLTVTPPVAGGEGWGGDGRTVRAGNKLHTDTHEDFFLGLNLQGKTRNKVPPPVAGQLRPLE